MMTCLYAPKLATAVQACNSYKPKNTVQLCPLRMVRV